MKRHPPPGVEVRLEDVRLTLGDTAFRFDVSVAPGTLAAVIGPSGAGKSTLLSLVAGLERPASGRVLIAGEDVTELGPAERPVSIVFQDNNLFAHLDARTNVGLGIHPGLKLGKHDWQVVEAALSRVGLAGFGRRLPGSLSGGERQRVALARCLVRRQPVLLLDEPFAALGPSLKADMLSLVGALQRDAGATALMVTHDPDDAAAIADAMIFVRRGAVAAAGPADRFLARTDIDGLAEYLGRRR
ncbi:MAG: thiamine ABC transporter ATP-binding protein [Pararhizobium sp.]